MFQVLSPKNDNLTFEDSDHRTFTARSVVNESTKRHDEGDHVTVHYDPTEHCFLETVFRLHGLQYGHKSCCVEELMYIYSC